jgi:hypothetical protein
MIPKEKAKELVKRYACLNRGEYINDWIDRDIIFDFIDLSSALIAVDEIIKNNKNIHFYVSGKTLEDLDIANKEIYKSMLHNIEYWQEVKQEIEKL